ncbi:hypothetical protein PoB_005441900 [Plakobranchus ocellatus]|uniref:Uncharacterized protein n=1 Tax=Plakobranchus ocellatus TaxID=259542 RepID=A0AAV4CB38_9GAST|nr:hypothetical protein PoB_005441900 [Plakobranchus ocellatus]
MKKVHTLLSVLKLDLENKNVFLSHTGIDPGFKCSQPLKDSKTSPKAVMDFKMEAKEFLKAICMKLLKKMASEVQASTEPLNARPSDT